jgi:5-formyltetrahydrofolate cyclo-ligase
MSKTDIRLEISETLRRLTARDRALKSTTLAAALQRLPEWRAGGSVLAYVSRPDEADTRTIIHSALEAGKRVYAPRVAGNDIVFHALERPEDASVKHAYGMFEPAADLPVFPAGMAPGTGLIVLVPGLAFDERKNRLGRGKGYYDRALRALRDRPGRERLFILGLCFEEQVLPAVPVTETDERMDAVLTDRRLVR